jgi:hypothetical protein
MSTGSRPTLRRRVGLALSGAACGAVLALPACSDTPPNIGRPPPVDAFFFPAGVAIDDAPERAVEGRPRWLFVGSANNDLRFNAGALVPVDLEAFWDAWFDPQLQTARPYCEDVGDGGDIDHCVLPPATPTTAERPCRRLAGKPTVVECDEKAFARDEATVRFGNFSTVIGTSHETSATGDFLRLWIPVRGDPSLTFVDVRGSGDELRLDCGQGDDEIDDRLCGDDHRLEHERNDEDLEPLAREPFTVFTSDAPGQRDRFLAVAHADGPFLTLVDLDGVLGDDRPAIVDQPRLFTLGDLDIEGAGGFGLTQRPCFAAGEGPLGDADPEPNVPAITEDCTRPLFYASMRYAQFVASFTASGVRLPPVAPVIAEAERTDCFADLPVRCMGDVEACDAPAGACQSEACERVYAGQYCATPDEIGQPCAVLCEPEVRSRRVFQPGGLLGDVGVLLPRLADLEFGDERGDELWILQSNPGALIKLDTSLDDNGEPRDIPSSPPIEICAEPNRMTLYSEAGQRFALISCYAAALVYVVDLAAERVVADLIIGTGPHDLVVDEARRVLYVTNTLEASVSVIDLARDRPTRFEEIARIGLQEPFSR